MKRTFKFIIILVIMMAILGIGNKVEAASVSLNANKEVNVGDTITITASVTAAQWDLKIVLNGETLAASEELDNYASNITKTFSATYKATQAGKLTFYLKGDATDFSQDVKSVNESIIVDVKVPQPEPEPEPEQPTTPDPKPETPVTPEPKPETPVTPPVEQKPEFKDTNKTMYASKDINLRASWSTESAATSIGEGTELTVTATSSNKVNGYVWYRVTYNGKTLYVASNLLTDKKPEKAEEPEQPVEENPQETPNVEEPQNTDQKDEKIDNIVKDGLKSLQIEGVTLSPIFNPEVYEYRTVVKENISELVINAVPAVEGATVTIAGNTKLAEGENLITIVVYNAEGNVEATYQITVNKNTLDLSETDNILKLGTKTARRNLIIFIAILIIVLIALIVVMVLRRKNQSDEEYDEEQEFTNNEENVENGEETVVEEEQVNEEDNQEEAQRPRRDKRKGKHF